MAPAVKIAAPPKPRAASSRPWVQQPGPRPDEISARLISWTREVYNVAGGWLTELRRQWAINKAVRIGQQYAHWNPQGRLSGDSRTPKHRVRMSVNMIHPVVEQFKGLILKTRPTATVMPASNDQADIDAARAGEKVIDYHWRVLRMQRQLNYIVSWFLETGCCFTETIWDPTKGGLEEAVDEQGKPLPDPLTGRPMVDSLGRALRFSLGQCDVVLVPPYQVIPDLNARSIDEMGWIQRSWMMPLAEIRRRWPSWGQHVTSEPLDVNNSIEYQFNRLTAANNSGDLQLSQGATDWARVHQTWVRPGSALAGRIYPDGCLVTQAQGYGTVERNPYQEARGYDPQQDWHPFTMWSCYYVGRFWPIGVVDNLWPIQREINRITSNLIEWQRLTGRPKVLLPNGCGISEQQFTAEAGEKLYYNSTVGAPSYLSAPTIPPAAVGLLEKMHENIDNVSNQHGPSRGQVPTTIKSGIGISLLQEQDAVDLGPLMGLFEDSIADVGRKILLRVSQFWKVRRVVQVLGKNRQLEAFHFSGADLGGNVDVQVQAGSGLPKSKAAQQALVEKLIQLGLYHPLIPEHRKVLLSILEMGESADDKFDTDKDRRRARFENEVMVQAVTVPPVAWYEDLEAHVTEHIDFMKTDQFRSAAVANPAIDAMFNLHIAMHFQAGNQLMGQSPSGFGAAMNGPAGGGAGGEEGGPAGGGKRPLNKNNSMGGMNGLQGSQANREQTMGNQPGVSRDNPSMGS